MTKRVVCRKRRNRPEIHKPLRFHHWKVADGRWECQLCGEERFGVEDRLVLFSECPCGTLVKALQ